MPTHSDKDRRLWEMMRNAERRIKKEDHIPQKSWKSVRCPNCDRKIEYREGKDWRGTLLCDKRIGGCGTRFKPPSLNGFI